MRYIRQTAVILAVTFLGEVLRALIPLPIPASVYGMALMLAFLCLGIVPLRAVDETATFLTDIMPVMFIPAGAGLMASWGSLKAMLVPALIAVVPVTALVMAAAGRTSQRVIDRGRGGR